MGRTTVNKPINMGSRNPSSNIRKFEIRLSQSTRRTGNGVARGADAEQQNFATSLDKHESRNRYTFRPTAEGPESETTDSNPRRFAAGAQLLPAHFLVLKISPSLRLESIKFPDFAHRNEPALINGARFRLQIDC